MKRLFSKQIFALILTPFMLAGALSSAKAETADKFSLVTGLEMKYSDNVIFVYNGTGSTRSGDFFFHPYLNPKMKFGEGPYFRKLTAYLSGEVYATYSALNNASYSLLFEQGVGQGKSLGFRYHISPFLFVGEEVLGNPNPINPSYAYRLEIYTVSYDQDLRGGAYLYLFAKYAIKDYNPLIGFRTGILRSVGGDYSFKPEKSRTFLFGVTVETFNAVTGPNSISGPPAINFIDDTTYNSLWLSVLWIEHLSVENTLRAKYQIKLRNYLADASEPLHGGRTDNTHDISLIFIHKMTDQWSWKTGLEIIDRISNKSYAAYNEDILSAGIERRFN